MDHNAAPAAVAAASCCWWEMIARYHSDYPAGIIIHLEQRVEYSNEHWKRLRCKHQKLMHAVSIHPQKSAVQWCFLKLSEHMYVIRAHS